MFRSTILRTPVATRHFLRRFSDTVSSDASSTSTSSSSVLSLDSFEFVQTRSDDRIAFIELHRPRELNCLNEQSLSELAEAVHIFDTDPSISVILLHGSDRVFATGMDVPSLASRSFHSIRHRNDPLSPLDRISKVKKPLIAAVNGFALGTGCELAMTADIIIASQDATFGQPEIQLGMIPGAGGTQRLVRAVGKAKAMEMVLTGRQMTAEEAESAGLVSRVTEKGGAIKEATEVAQVITRYSVPVLISAKECVNVGFESMLNEGLTFERRAFQNNFALADCKEGLKAFVDGRKPHFSDR